VQALPDCFTQHPNTGFSDCSSVSVGVLQPAQIRRLAQRLNASGDRISQRDLNEIASAVEAQEEPNGCMSSYCMSSYETSVPDNDDDGSLVVLAREHIRDAGPYRDNSDAREKSRDDLPPAPAAQPLAPAACPVDGAPRRHVDRSDAASTDAARALVLGK